MYGMLLARWQCEHVLNRSSCKSLTSHYNCELMAPSYIFYKLACEDSNPLGDVHVDGRYITNTKKSMICPGMRFIYGKLKAILLRSVHESKRSLRCWDQCGYLAEYARNMWNAWRFIINISNIRDVCTPQSITQICVACVAISICISRSFGVRGLGFRV